MEGVRPTLRKRNCFLFPFAHLHIFVFILWYPILSLKCSGHWFHSYTKNPVRIGRRRLIGTMSPDELPHLKLWIWPLQSSPVTPIITPDWLMEVYLLWPQSRNLGSTSILGESTLPKREGRQLFHAPSLLRELTTGSTLPIYSSVQLQVRWFVCALPHMLNLNQGFEKMGCALNSGHKPLLNQQTLSHQLSSMIPPF